ncbi:TetR/AcrR family transcriptional regulator [Kineosporia babensis]|uniref:TetR family transcriptional regulator n=1 Tax=Kineosporia babensis TaxID=499548 RepID=A0A9X1NBC1_9ACTN|nr:hypothetical protein [Kineosporia babensis]MCD5310146.1 hypothetical protein [Kineosporia babensis]
MAQAPYDPKTGTRRRGRPPELERTAIAQAALAEISGFSVAKVARRLGSTPGALYHHVSGRAELITMAAQAALEEVHLPEPEPGPALDWRGYLHDVAETLLAALQAHPGLALALTELNAPPPSYARMLQQAQVVLAGHGVAERTARTAIHLLGHLAMDEAMAAAHREPEAELWGWTFRERVELVLDGVAFRRP